MNGQNFEPSPELQALIDEAHDRRLRERQDTEWTSGRGVIIDPERVKRRLSASSVSAVSSSAYAGSYVQIMRPPYSLT